MAPPKSVKPPKKSSSMRFSVNEEWHIAELIKQGYGESASEVVRRFLWDGIRAARKQGHLPSPPKRKWSDVPSPEEEG